MRLYRGEENMVVNSTDFLLFFIVVFYIYYFPLKEKTKAQNILLLFVSYFFYGYVDLKMLPLLITNTVVFYFIGIGISHFNKMESVFILSGL
jgi:alginate O-acetyltransferase complex protein AlgI